MLDRGAGDEPLELLVQPLLGCEGGGRGAGQGLRGLWFETAGCAWCLIRRKRFAAWQSYHSVANA